MIRVKQGKRGAVIKVMPVEVLLGLVRAEAIFASHGFGLVITEWWRLPRRGKPSLHPAHFAVDVRANNIEDATREFILADLRTIMEETWDFALHGKGASIHFHMEYQPKSSPQPR